ncbi:Protein of unknown function [Cotesia congregata]|uniref:Uncharacterized protein n=1 Tax=Cotesia congregata TaxID=51543 RepID=A0A8J2MEI3_COTCN|nr:Protein of unknown function [Cotesia congregata]
MLVLQVPRSLLRSGAHNTILSATTLTARRDCGVAYLEKSRNSNRVGTWLHFVVHTGELKENSRKAREPVQVGMNSPQAGNYLAHFALKWPKNGDWPQRIALSDCDAPPSSSNVQLIGTGLQSRHLAAFGSQVFFNGNRLEALGARNQLGHVNFIGNVDQFTGVHQVGVLENVDGYSSEALTGPQLENPPSTMNRSQREWIAIMLLIELIQMLDSARDNLPRIAKVTSD